MFALFEIIFAIVAIVLDHLLGTDPAGPGAGYIYSLFSLAMLIPGLAVMVRRLHDVNKSGWFFFIVFIPLVGAIWLLVLMCTEGTRNDNQYGSDPKAFEALAY